jgi:hypothetical protein
MVGGGGRFSLFPYFGSVGLVTIESGSASGDFTNSPDPAWNIKVCPRAISFTTELGKFLRQCCRWIGGSTNFDRERTTTKPPVVVTP